MSDLLRDLETSLVEVTGCKLCHYLETMTDEYSQATKNALVSKTNHTRIAEILTRNGYPITEASVRRHRKGHIT